MKRSPTRSHLASMLVFAVHLGACGGARNDGTRAGSNHATASTAAPSSEPPSDEVARCLAEGRRIGRPLDHARITDDRHFADGTHQLHFVDPPRVDGTMSTGDWADCQIRPDGSIRIVGDG